MKEKGFALPLILIATIGVLIVGGLIFYIFRQNSQLEAINKAQAALNEEKVQLEKDLIFYKNTDLAKEVELLQVKLKSTEKDLATTQNETTNLKNKVSTYETNSKKISPYLEAINAIQKTFFGGDPFTKSVPEIDQNIATLKDTEVSQKWTDAKRDIDIYGGSWFQKPVGDTLTLIISRIRNLLP